MLYLDQLSYWEKNTFTDETDFLIIGAGIVGSACALKLRELHPKARILIVERGYLPSGASTKNAGFACFGSATEIADDLKHIPEDAVWNTVRLRWEGLQRLQERFDPAAIELRFRGSWDLIDDGTSDPVSRDQLAYFNEKIREITGFSDCFSIDRTIAQTCRFKGISGGYYNRLEGELNTGRLFVETQKLLAAAEIHSLFGIEVQHIEPNGTAGNLVHTNYGTLKTGKVAITVNGFAAKLLEEKRILPARAQVMVSKHIPGFELPGTFHYKEGYYYFRSIDNRLLIGGGRNLDKTGETTTELENTPLITESLKTLVREKILPGREVKMDYQWAGIMGVGDKKEPLIELLSPTMGMAVRMGGMGVAIGSKAGEKLATLLQ